ncbi:MAG: VTT domain-containing protein [Planctomycetota bacterium]
MASIQAALEPRVLPAGGAPPGHVRPLPGLRAWFAFFIAWMGGLTAAAVLLLRASDGGGGADALHAWLLVLMCFYLSLCNSLVPLPTAWIVLLAASPEFALTRHDAVNVVLVALLATTATVIANLNEYHVLGWLFRSRIGARVRRTRVYDWAGQWFDRAPFQLLILIAFLPLPLDAVRWLAILRQYPRGRFALAYLIGRGPRYLLFAWLSVLVNLTPTQIALIQAGILGLALAGRLLWKRLAAGPGRPGKTLPLVEETAADSAAR